MFGCFLLCSVGEFFCFFLAVWEIVFAMQRSRVAERQQAVGIRECGFPTSSALAVEFEAVLGGTYLVLAAVCFFIGVSDRVDSWGSLGYGGMLGCDRGGVSLLVVNS